MVGHKKYRIALASPCLGLCALWSVPAKASSEVPTLHVNTVASVKKSRNVRVHRPRAVPSRPSVGQLNGLHATGDPLELKSSVALVLDQDTNEVLLAKNPQAVLPIASITKLMTALVVADAGLALDETLAISAEGVDTEKGSRSRLRVGTALTREEMLHLALMVSENRAAHALWRATMPPACQRPAGPQAPAGASQAVLWRNTTSRLAAATSVSGLSAAPRAKLPGPRPCP